MWQRKSIGSTSSNTKCDDIVARVACFPLNSSLSYTQFALMCFCNAFNPRRMLVLFSIPSKRRRKRNSTSWFIYVVSSCTMYTVPNFMCTHDCTFLCFLRILLWLNGVRAFIHTIMFLLENECVDWRECIEHAKCTYAHNIRGCVCVYTMRTILCSCSIADCV